MTEIWKDIKGHEGVHQISNLGRVRSVDFDVTDIFKGKERTRHIHGRILKQMALPTGYMIVCFTSYPNISVHREVAKAFVPGYFEGAEVNHKDENKQNNRWDNLEWVTREENQHYGTRIDRITSILRERRGIPVEQYDDNGNMIATYQSIRQAANTLGVDKNSIQEALKRKIHCKGYLFKRKTN